MIEFAAVVDENPDRRTSGGNEPVADGNHVLRLPSCHVPDQALPAYRFGIISVVGNDWSGRFGQKVG